MSRKVYYFILKMKLQLTLLVLGLTYVLSAPTDPSESSEDFWIKIKEDLEETKTKGMEINTFIQEQYNDFQDLDTHITGADDASKDYFNNVLVERFEEIKEKTIPVQEGLEKAQQLVREKMTPGKDYFKELDLIDFQLKIALKYLAKPYEVYLPEIKSDMEKAFNLKDEQEKEQQIKKVVEEIKADFERSRYGIDFRSFSIVIGTIDYVLYQIKGLLRRE